jgi:hypothetical protein
MTLDGSHVLEIPPMIASQVLLLLLKLGLASGSNTNISA